MLKREKIYLALISLVFVILTTIPYLYFWEKTPENNIYTGTNYLLSNDNFVYYSYIEQIKQNSFLLQDLFTSEKLSPVLNVFWLSIGIFAKIFNLSAPLAFHISRILLSFVLVYVLYHFLSLFFKNYKSRIFALIFLLFTSGVGGIFLHFISKPTNYLNQIYYYPIDQTLVESNIFLSALLSPHHIASLICILLIFTFLLKSFLENSFKYLLISGFIALFYFQFHPFFFLLVALTLAMFITLDSWNNKKINYSWLLKSLAFLAFSLIPLVYFYFIQTNYYNNLKDLQNVTLSPQIWYILPSILFYGIFIILGLKNNKNDKNIILLNAFLLSWLLSGLVLMYLPLPFQSRFIKSLQIPMVILDFQGLLYLKDKYLKRWNLLFIFAIFICFSLSNILVYYKIFDLTPKIDNLYISTEKIKSLNWVKKNIDKSSIILAKKNDGLLITAFCGKKVFFGHPIETINFQNKSLISKSIFEKENIDLAKENNINYIYQDKKSKAIKNALLENIFENSDVIIYKIR